MNMSEIRHSIKGCLFCVCYKSVKCTGKQVFEKLIRLNLKVGMPLAYIVSVLKKTRIQNVLSQMQ